MQWAIQREFHNFYTSVERVEKNLCALRIGWLRLGANPRHGVPSLVTVTDVTL
jgi:hypothetical protein